ncbi:hypothetical protein GPALN_005997 [Globodera pallida]|nr:hypothetical protein GPALN_005997 [Globodera pallida]
MGDRSRFDHVPEQPACLKERRQEQKQPRIPSARAHAVCPSVGWRQTLPEQPACLKARRQEQKQPRIPSARARMPCSRPLQGGRSKSNRAFQARARACRVPARWLETNPPRAAGMFKSKAAGAKATAHSKRARAHAVFPPVGGRSKSNRAFQARARACRVPARWLETNPPRAAGMFKSKAAGAKATEHSKRARACRLPARWSETNPPRVLQ